MSHCPRCQELEDEIRSLRRELAYEIDRIKAHDLRHGLKLTKGLSEILWLLYTSNGRNVTVEAMDDLTTGRNGIKRQGLKVFQVQICRLRELLGAESIETVQGIGYRLTPLGRILCEEAIEGRRA